jgi:hypothetical protein
VKLYNLDNDIREETDVADEFPEIVKQIEEAMKEAHQKPELKRFDIFDPVQTQR